MAFCKACGSAVDGVAFCPSCGTETGATSTGSGTAMPVPESLQAPQQPRVLAEPIGTLGAWLQGLLVASGVITVLLIPAQINALNIAQDYNNGDISQTNAVFEIADAQSGGLQGLSGLIPVAIFILFIIWTHRAYKNLYAFGVQTLPKSTGWAIGGWFIPFYNAFGQKTIIDNIWRATAPEPIDPSWTTRAREQWFTIGWWTYWAGSLLSLIVGAIVAQSIVVSFNGTSGDITVVPPAWAFQLGLLAALLSAAGQIVTAYGLRTITARYESRREQGAAQI